MNIVMEFKGVVDESAIEPELDDISAGSTGGMISARPYEWISAGPIPVPPY